MVTVPTEEEKVLPGRDGWLFLQRDSNDVIGQLTGRVRLGRQGRRAWRRLLSKRVAVMNGFGIPWVAQIAPNKESVYPEHLPTEIVPSRRRPVHELLRVAKRTRAPVTYPVNALMGAKSKGTLYF